MKVCKLCWSSFVYIIIIKLVLLLLIDVINALKQQHVVKGFYTLTAPSSIYSGRPYGVTVTTFNCMFSTSFEVSLSGPNLNMREKLHTTRFDPKRSHVFNVPELKSAIYWLRVKTNRGLIVNNSTQLVWRTFKTFIKIHTPKMLYRPGQLLKFIVFYHNERMIGVAPEPMALIWIEDAKGNRVKVYKKLKVIRGVFESELRLSRQPNLGNWRICSQNGNGNSSIEECAYIKVMDYELPSFEVTLEAPKEVYLENGTIQVHVLARYAIDSPVAGNLTLNTRTYKDGETKHRRTMMKQTAQLENGKATLLLELEQFKSKIIPNMPLQLQLSASVQENFSDELVTVSRIVILWGPADDRAEFVLARAPRPKRNNLIKIEKFGLPINAPQKIIFQLDRKHKTAVCVIVYNGIVLASELVYSNKPKLDTFEILVQFTNKMWPFVQVILYSMQTDSNLLNIASQTVTVQREKHEHVIIKAPSVVRPGTNITFQIKSVPHSYMNLAAVDSRVIQMAGKSNNDLSHDYFDNFKNLMRATASDISSNDKLTYQISGLIILSNAAGILNMAKQETNLQTETSTRDDLVETALSPLKIPNNLCCKLPATREKFNDVWIYDSIKSTKAGWTTWHASVPNAITTWRLSAFSVDSKVGLTLLEPKPFINIKSIKPIFMTLSVPYSMKVDEILNLTLSCTNRENEDVNVTISLKQDVDRFELLDNEGATDSKLAKQIITISSNGTNLVTFNLRALKPGTINLAFSAESKLAKDSLTRDIEVLKKPQRLTKHIMSYQKLASPKRQTEFKLNLTQPPTEDGVTCFVAGHVLIGKLQSLNLIEPTDNTEQMISKLMLFHNMWNYVRDKQWISAQYKQYLEDQLNDGFQSLLRLRGPKGGFKYTYRADCVSTWLTAYALELMHLLKNTPIYVEQRIQTSCEGFLLNRTNSAGQFVDSCATQGRRNLSQVELNIEVIKVLKLSGRLQYLKEAAEWTNEQMAILKDDHLLAKYGENSIVWKEPVNQKNASWMQKHRNLETAGRLLLKDISRKRTEQQEEIFKWLMHNLFADSDNVNCYECVTAQLAIFEYLQSRESVVPQLTLTIWTDPERPTKLLINAKNRWQEQKVLIKPQDSFLNFKAAGEGHFLLSCNYDYELTEPDDERKLYRVRMRVSKGQPLKVKFCVRRTKIDVANYVGSSIELQLPSGYELDRASVQALLATNIVQQANLLDGNTKLFANLVGLVAGKIRCWLMVARKYHKLEKLQPGTLSIWDINAIQTREVFVFNANLS